MLKIICRTCLALEGNFSSIYDSKGSNCVADMVGDITSHTPKPSDGLPQMVCLTCVQEINRCYLFKIKCLNSESMLKQLLYSCKEDPDAAISDSPLERNQNIVARDRTLSKEEVDIPNVVDGEAVGEAYIVIDLKHENERLEIKHEVEKQMQLRYTNEEDRNAANPYIPHEEKENAKQRGCETPDVEFVENDKVSCVVIDSDEEIESLDVGPQVGKHLEMLHGEHVCISNTDNPLEKNQKSESEERALPHIDAPDIEFIEIAKESQVVIDLDEEDANFGIEHKVKKHGELLFCKEDNTRIGIERNVEFVESDKVPCVVIDSDGEVEHMETENEVDKDLNSGFINKENGSVASVNTDTTGCILTEQDGTQDEPYVVIDLECESERLEIKHEVQKHLQLLYNNKGNAHVEIPAEEMPNVEARVCTLPQVDELNVELVEVNNQTYIVVDSEDETVQFEIQHVVNEHSTPNITKKYHPQKPTSLLKVKNNLKPSFPTIQTAVKNSKVSKVNRKTEPDQISDNFSHIFDYFDTGGEGELDQDCSVDFAPPAEKLKCTKCALKFVDPTNLREHMSYCEIIRQDKSTTEHSTFPPFESHISNSGNVDSAPASDETNMTRKYVRNETIQHQCPVCQACFAHRLLLTHHMRLHPGGSRYYCSICKRAFSTESSLNDHKLLHGGNKPNQCEECPQSFYSIEQLRLHVRGHTGDSPFVCDLCQPLSKSDKDLDCRGTDKYSDRKENGVTQAKDESDTNIIIVGDDTACPSSTQTNDQMNDNMEHDEQASDNVKQLYMQAHRCSDCGAGFEKRKFLEIHINQSKCSTKPFVCCQCKRQSFSYRNKAICRLAIPFCHICKIVLPNDEDLLQHNLKIHKVKSQCPIYRKKLQIMSAVKVRMRRHREHRTAKPVKCEKCPHFRRHTGDQPYACPICPKRTKSCDVVMQDDPAEELTAECRDADSDNAVKVTTGENSV